MSPSVKLSLLALVSAAAAVPHYGHNRYHKPSGGYGAPSAGQPAYPTGGWLPSNTTAVYPTDTAVVPDEKTTTIDETYTSTTTIVSTIYIDASPVPEQPAQSEYPASALPQHVSSGAPVCGPETVYVTATNQVTVTVTAGEAVPSSSAAAPTGGYQAPPPPAPEAPVSSAPAPSDGYQAPPAPTPEAPTPSAVQEGKVSVSLPHKGVENPTTSEQASQPVQTSAPAPPSGGKVGLAYNDAALCKNFAGKASWAYSWSSSPLGDLPQGIKFIPMPWVKNESPTQWLKKVDELVAAGSDTVMGFNEVDHPSQSNMDPSTACQRWAEYMDPVKSAHPGVTIIGPSVTNAGDKPNWGLDWYKNFMAACPGAKWDATNLHFYDIWQEGEGNAGTINRFISHIENAAKLTNKPVWVTEFGLNPGSTSEDTAKFLRAAMKYMDGSDKVHGYSYFMVGAGENQLISGNSLSPIGELYAASA